MTNFLTLTKMRIQLTLRNKMFLFFSVIMPFGFFFLYAGVFAKGNPVVVRYLLGPVLALTVMGSFWGLSAALVMFREQGILRRFHVTPVTPSDMLASSIVANFVLTLPTVIVELLFARFIFHVKDFGNIGTAFILITLGTMSFASLGLVVASVTNTMQETQVINQLIWLPLIFLSGATIPLIELPRVVQRVGLFLPATYLVTELQDAIYWAAVPWNRDVLIAIASLALWATLTFFYLPNCSAGSRNPKFPAAPNSWSLATALPFVLLGIWENSSSRTIAKAKAMSESLSAPAKADSPPPH